MGSMAWRGVFAAALVWGAGAPGFAADGVFEPGYGAAVGSVESVEGQGVLRHEGSRRDYAARSGLPLFRGDLLELPDGSRARLALADGSRVWVAGAAKCIVHRVVSDPPRRARSAFLTLENGKARFVVQKLPDYKQSEFRVRTRTAVAGVRGSDFVIEAAEAWTRVTALEDTLIDVRSLAHPEEAPTPLGSFQRSSVDRGASPRPPEGVTREEAVRLTGGLASLGPGGGEPAGTPGRAPAEAAGGTRSPPEEGEEGGPGANAPARVLPLPGETWTGAEPPSSVRDDGVRAIVEDEIRRLPGFPGPPR